jgi:probable rRNA maturation factor
VARGVERGHLDLSFVGRDEIAALNTEHMDADGPTDVLAFPLDAEISAETVGPSAAAETGGPDATDAEAPVLLGDVVICSEVAHANAHIHGRSTDDELALLVVHGVLHILGMDHYDPAERDQMQAAERELLAELHESVVGP